MEEAESEREQEIFYEKVVSYVQRHPEFVEELQRRIEEEEKGYDAGQEKRADDSGKKKRIFGLDEEKISRISDELSGMLFDRDKSNRSVLEKTVQDAFSGMVRNYLSKYA